MNKTQARAFEGFVAESGDMLLRVATLLTSDQHLAEDVYQETLHRLAARWTHIDHPRAFCRRVMHNIVIDQTRARQRRPAIKLTAAQQTLNQLSSAAATARPPAGRYVVMAERQGPDKRTSVIDSKTGDVWTFQAGHGIPAELPEAKYGSPTEAELAAYPTDPAALRTQLIAQAKQQQAQGIKAMLAQLAKSHDPGARQKARMVRSSQPIQTSDDWAFSQAAYLLWNPLVRPPLRAALFKVLAGTPGVVVNSHARDSLGRPAVEISRYDKGANYTEAIFESPDASRVLETTSIQPGTPAHDGLPAEAGYQASDTYLSITWTNTRPTRNPYGG